MINSKIRGNKVYYNENKKEWEGVNIDKKSFCCKCNKNIEQNSHDYCIKNLKGVMNACCGHGIVEDCYIQLLDKTTIKGLDANIIINVLKKYTD